MSRSTFRRAGAVQNPAMVPPFVFFSDGAGDEAMQPCRAGCPDRGRISGASRRRRARRRRCSGLLWRRCWRRSGWLTPQRGRVSGRPHRIGDFEPAERGARADRIPGLMAHYLPSLIETLNIGAVLADEIGFRARRGRWCCRCRARAIWPRALIVAPVRRVMDLFRALPEIVVALALIFALGGGPVPAMPAITPTPSARSANCSPR